jgi:signal transduction histidine kinase
MTDPPRQPGDARLLRRVRWRLVVWSAGSTLLLLVLLGGALYLSVQRSFEASGVAQLEQQAATLEEFARHDAEQFPDHEGGDGREDDSPFGRPLFGGPGSGTLSIVVGPDGEIVGNAPPESNGLPFDAGFEAAMDGGTDVRTSTVNGTPSRILSAPIDVEGERYVIQVAQDRSAEERALATLLLVLTVGGLVVLAVAALFGFAYAGRALVPIRESLRRQREFAADASHELRTPLTVVRSSVEHLRRHPERAIGEVGTAIEDIEAEVTHLTTLVDDLLLLARTDSGAVELRRERVDLAETAAEAVQGLRSGADSRGIQLQLDAAPVSVDGDSQRLRQLVAILVDNALRHTPTGGAVNVAVRTSPPAITVEDDGPGIREQDLPHLFDRFWRSPDAPAGGTGLGLAIARWIVEHHGGQIRASNRIDRRGARFEVTLPAS